MELSDYEILGISQNATFRQIKNAYYDLARIYHPDSKFSDNYINKKDKQNAIKKINKAYENIKKKMNIIETDLPKEDSKYEPLQIKKIIELENISNDVSINDINKNFNNKFNFYFNKFHKEQNKNDPFSIYYIEPNDNNKTKFSNKLIETNQIFNNQYEFGINYVNNHSSDIFTDIRYTNNKIIENENENQNENENENKNENENEKSIDTLYENLIKEREKIIKLSDNEIEFIKNQDKIKNEILKSKKNIYENEQKLLIN
jgi:curved DNA-binding protein CbpA